jgi:hypothetical protein
MTFTQFLGGGSIQGWPYTGHGQQTHVSLRDLVSEGARISEYCTVIVWHGPVYDHGIMDSYIE